MRENLKKWTQTRYWSHALCNLDGFETEKQMSLNVDLNEKMKLYFLFHFLWLKSVK